MVAKSFAPIIAGSGGVLLEAPDTLPESGVLALAVNAAGKMSAVEFPETTRASLGLATTDSPTFAGATFSGPLQAATIEGATTLSLKTAGATRADYNITSTASWTFVSSAFNVGSNVRIPATNFFFWQSRSVILSPADGQIQFLTQNGSNFSALILGPATASFPSIRRNGTAINFRLADNSADAPISASNALFYKTNTSATSYEALQLDAATDASNFDIAASIGSAGGTARGIRIGGKNAAGTFTSWLSFATSGGATFSGNVSTPGNVSSTSYFIAPVLYFASFGGFITSTGSGAATNVDLCTQSSVRIRNYTNNADAPIKASNITASGALQIGNAAVAETPVATHTLIIKDSTGTSYRVLAVAV